MNRLTEFPAEDVFLETEIAPQADGTYVVPVASQRRGLHRPGVARDAAAGTRGYRVRRSDTSVADEVRVEAWVKKDPLVLDGHSPWQGKWVPLARRDSSRRFHIHAGDRRGGQPGGRTRHVQGAVAVPCDTAPVSRAPSDGA